MPESDNYANRRFLVKTKLLDSVSFVETYRSPFVQQGLSINIENSCICWYRELIS